MELNFFISRYKRYESEITWKISRVSESKEKKCQVFGKKKAKKRMHVHRMETVSVYGKATWKVGEKAVIYYL